MPALSTEKYDTDWYQTDWAWGSNSHHVANRKEWFSSFVDFKFSLWKDSKRFEVLGVGDVELELTNLDGNDGQMYYNKVVLREVLYMPGLPANIFGGNQDSFGASYMFKRGGYFQPDGSSKLPRIVSRSSDVDVGILDNTARPYDSWCDIGPGSIERGDGPAKTSARWAGWRFGPFVLSREVGKLWLKGQKFGHTSMEDSAEWLERGPAFSWGGQERDLWLASVGFRHTEEQKAWLKLWHGNELKFLQQFGFSIYDHDHRLAGTNIVNIMLENDNVRRAGLACLYYNTQQSQDQTSKDFYTYMQGLEACMKMASMSVLETTARVGFYWTKFRISTDGNVWSSMSESTDAERSIACNTVEELIEAIAAKQSAQNIRERTMKKNAEHDFFRRWRQPTHEERLAARQEKLSDTVQKIASRITNRLFTPQELKWIKDHHTDSGTFMVALNLVPWEKEDCRKAQQIVQTAMVAELDDDGEDAWIVGQVAREAMLIDG